MGLDKQNFARLLKEARAASGLSGAHLAERVNVDPSYVVLLESGRRAPSVDILCDLAVALGVNPAVLLGTAPIEPVRPPVWLAELMPDLAALDRPGQAAVKALVKGLAKGGR